MRSGSSQATSARPEHSAPAEACRSCRGANKPTESLVEEGSSAQTFGRLTKNLDPFDP